MDKNSDIDNFAANLKFLCGFYPSVSEVCRKLDINRQQFNRYLGGDSMPSYKNLKKICDFFGVESEEIVERNDIFRTKVSPPNQQDGKHSIPEDLANIIGPLARSSARGMERFEGFYYRYFYAFGFPGYIWRSFIRIYKSDDIYYLKTIERITRKNAMLGGPLTFKHRGLVFFLADRLFMIEVDTPLNATIAETILTPSYRPNNPYMPGIISCTSTGISHEPGAARTVFEYLGNNIDVRRVMRECDLFHHLDDSIPENVKRTIRNSIAPEEFTLHPPKN